METIKGTHLESMPLSQILVDKLDVRARNSQIKAIIGWGKDRKTIVSKCYS